MYCKVTKVSQSYLLAVIEFEKQRRTFIFTVLICSVQKIQSRKSVVCYTAVFGVVTQRSSPLGEGGSLRCGEGRCETTLKTAV